MSKANTNVSLVEILGSAVINLVQAFKYIFKLQVLKDNLIKRLVFLGYESILMIVILTAIASMIMTVNTAIELTHYGGRELIGALITVSGLREIIPIFIAFAIAARCGTALTAEISTMKVTEQIDVLKVLKIDPVAFLLAPTILAGLILAPILQLISSIVGIASGMLIAKIYVNLEFTEFLDSAWKVLTMKELFLPIIKTEIFILYSLLISITMGLNCNGGAKDVGLTTTRATALVIVGIIILDSFLTPLLYLD